MPATGNTQFASMVGSKLVKLSIRVLSFLGLQAYLVGLEGEKDKGIRAASHLTSQKSIQMANNTRV